ncbi:MAG: hypothetical protein GY754_28885, partial [bacterium]|nr:hypothetical protein [bacterium]
SFEPGDSRIDCYIPHYVNENINEQAVYTGIVGENYLLPDVVGANIAPVTRMGFFRQDAESISSTDAGPSGPYWSDRNRLLPVIIALLGSLRDQTRYEAASSGNDYNYAGTHYYPLRTATDSLMPALAKPMFYFQKDSGTDPAKYPPDNCWKPRLGGANDYLLPAMFLTENDRDSYYLPKENRSLMSLLSENEYKEGNGLIPRLAQTKMTSGLLGMLQSMGK